MTVLWSTDPRRGRMVIAVSAAAMALGIRPPVPLVEARSLLPRQTQQASPLVFVAEHQPNRDLAALRALADELALTISPLVALEPLAKARWAGQLLHQPQACLLDVTGISQLLGSETELLRQTVDLLDARGLASRIALASTAGAAWAIAHAADPSTANQWDNTQPLVQQTYCWIVPPDQTVAALQSLPPTALRLPVETATKLHRLGINRIGDLLQLPRGGLASRLGTEVLWRIDQALGQVAEPLAMHQAAPEDSVTTELEYPTGAIDLLQHRAEQLLSVLTDRLRQRQSGVLRLRCHLELVQQAAATMTISFFAPTTDTAHIAGLLQHALEQQNLTAPVHRIVISAALTTPLRTRQLALLPEEDATDDPRQLAQLIDQASVRLGRQRVAGVSLTGQPLPEQSYRLHPLAGRIPGANRRSRTTKPSTPQQPECLAPQDWSATPHPSAAQVPYHAHAPLRRPLQLLTHPQILEVTQVHPDGWPSELRWAASRRRHRIIRAWGPERIETGWWQGAADRRDYFRLETAAGTWLWVFRSLKTTTWKLHGWFG